MTDIPQLDLVRNTLRPIVRMVRSAQARALHPFRRRATRGQVSGLPQVRRIVFMCHGNICRSPFAAVLFSREISRRGMDGIVVESAGFVAGGRSSPSTAIAVAAQHGIDLRRHVSRVVTARQWQSDIMVVMEPGQRTALHNLFGSGPIVVILGDLDPELPETRAIPDPVEKPAADFERSYARIERCIAELVSLLPVSSAQPTTTPTTAPKPAASHS